MRFKKIEKFKVDELHLDQGNYRFKKADNQEGCVEKIYFANPQYFKGLMRSIAADDLGELLLVYRNKKENIVQDGNRRLAALKVLSDDKYAPVEALKKYAEELRSSNKINFLNIQAQVSDDKKLVLSTVYERHASAKSGKARISWSAFAAARFRYIEKEDVTDEWHITALVLKAEEEHPKITEFLDSSNYSHEVFRRLLRAAFEKGIVSNNIFSKRDMRFKSSAPKNILNDAVAKSYKFLLAMKDKKISLSRKDAHYADKDYVDRFLLDFKLSPDNQRLGVAKSGSGEKVSGDSEKNNDDSEGKLKGDSANANNDSEDADGDGNDDLKTSSGKSGHGIDESDAILRQLKKLKSKKLSGLYTSLCVISLVKHPALMYVGAWSFFEVLSKCMGNISQDFPGYFGNHMSNLGLEKQPRKDCAKVLKDIQNHGNATKHSENATPMTAIQLKNDFVVLEPLIIAALGKSIDKKKKMV